MEKELKKYHFLVIGRMGDGKSSLCRFLTGDQGIITSSKIESCTHESQLYVSTDGFRDENRVEIEVIDTPGLDSKEQNLLQIVVDLASSLSKLPEINGILYVVSMVNRRDENIQWFLNFLALYFSKEQLSKCIIPILTNYDKLIFEDDSAVMEAKQSRKEAISKIWDPEGGEEASLSFWDNHVNWINEANQKQGIRLQEEFRQIYDNQLLTLLKKADHIKVNCREKAAEFEDFFLTRLEDIAAQKKGSFQMVEETLQPFKVKVEFGKMSFWKSLKEMKSSLSKLLIGSYVVLIARGYAGGKFRAFQKKSTEDNSSKIKDEVKEGVRRLVNLKFNLEVQKKLDVMTSSKNTEEDFNRMFSPSGKCWIKVDPLDSSFIRLIDIKMTRIPKQKEPYQCHRIFEKKYISNGEIIFEDPKRVLKKDEEEEFQYEFHSIKVHRPSDEACREFVQQIIKKSQIK